MLEGFVSNLTTRHICIKRSWVVIIFIHMVSKIFMVGYDIIFGLYMYDEVGVDLSFSLCTI